MKEGITGNIDYTTPDGLKKIVISLYDNYQFTVKEIGVDSRTVNYWKEKGLLTWLPPHKTGKFNFLQAAWICVLRSLKNAGQEVELMKKLTKYFVEEPVELKTAFDTIAMELKSLIEKGEADSKNAVYLRKCLENEKQMDKFRNEFSRFAILVNIGLKSKQNCGIFIGGKDHFSWYSNGIYIYQPDELMSIMYDFQIAIPLQPILKELIAIEIRNNNYESPILTDDEKLVLEELRRDDVDTITVNKRGKEIVIKVSKGVEQEIESYISEFKKGNLDGWDKFKISKRNGTTLYVEKEKRIKK